MGRADRPGRLAHAIRAGRVPRGVGRGLRGADITDLTEDDSRALGQRVSRCLAAYKDWNLTSFIFGLIGGGPLSRARTGYQVVLKLVSRSNPEPLYRSDATERLWAEALINMNPRRGRGPADQVLRAGACCRGSGPFGTQTVLNCENSGARYTVVGERCTPVRHRWRQPGRSMHLMGSAARTFSRG